VWAADTGAGRFIDGSTAGYRPDKVGVCGVLRLHDRERAFEYPVTGYRPTIDPGQVEHRPA
jgi:hypothetical protein